MFLLVINISRMIANIAWFTLALIVFIVLYRLLLKRLKSKRPSNENFFKLHPIEDDPARGTIQLFIELRSKQKVNISIYPVDESYSKLITDEEYGPGGHVIMLDTSKFQNGFYFIEARSEHQKTSKRFEIKND